MDPLSAILSAVGGYLVGSVSFGRIITRLASGSSAPDETAFGIEGTDTKMVYTGISATTVSTNVGAKYGFLTYMLDVLKVFVPVFLLKRLMPGTPYYLIAAITALIGHIWPLYHRFKGGRGISAIYGGVFAIDWIGVFIAAIGGMLMGLFVLRDLFFTYMAGLWLLVPYLWLRTRDIWIVLYAVAINIIFAIAALPELRQWAVVRKDEKWSDPMEAWQISGMGRGIIKMARKLGIVKKKKNDATHP
jgi:glycerol-3-phosphate acyltransferase PlsY